MTASRLVPSITATALALAAATMLLFASISRWADGAHDLARVDRCTDLPAEWRKMADRGDVVCDGDLTRLSSHGPDAAARLRREISIGSGLGYVRLAVDCSTPPGGSGTPYEAFVSLVQWDAEGRSRWDLPHPLLVNRRPDRWERLESVARVDAGTETLIVSVVARRGAAFSLRELRLTPVTERPGFRVARLALIAAWSALGTLVLVCWTAAPVGRLGWRLAAAATFGLILFAVLSPGRAPAWMGPPAALIGGGLDSARVLAAKLVARAAPPPSETGAAPARSAPGAEAAPNPAQAIAGPRPHGEATRAAASPEPSTSSASAASPRHRPAPYQPDTSASTPVIPEMNDLVVAKKLGHLVLFAILAVLVLWSVPSVSSSSVLPPLILLGAAIELLQVFAVDRGPKLTDVAINTAGILSGVLVARIGQRISRRRDGLRRAAAGSAANASGAGPVRAD